ncbi:MAG: YggT family protein [Treponema sp.]
MFSNTFYLLYKAIDLYTWVCIIRIFLSWMPHFLMTPLGSIFIVLCDPYLSFFKKFRFTYIAGLDFSPVLALGVLSFFANVAFSIYALGYFSIIGIIIILISSIWGVLKFFLNVLVFISLLRFILEFSYRYRSSSLCVVIDTIFYPLKSFIMKTFFKNNITREKHALLITFFFFLLIRILTELLIDKLFMLFSASSLFFYSLF